MASRKRPLQANEEFAAGERGRVYSRHRTFPYPINQPTIPIWLSSPVRSARPPRREAAFPFGKSWWRSFAFHLGCLRSLQVESHRTAHRVVTLGQRELRARSITNA